MKRYFDEKDRIVREYRKVIRWRKHYNSNSDDIKIGRYRKRKAFGCGTPKCLVCHYEKVFKIKSAKSKILDDKFTQSIEDYYDERD
jgi:hypothetical protein